MEWLTTLDAPKSEKGRCLEKEEVERTLVTVRDFGLVVLDIAEEEDEEEKGWKDGADLNLEEGPLPLLPPSPPPSLPLLLPVAWWSRLLSPNPPPLLLLLLRPVAGRMGLESAKIPG